MSKPLMVHVITNFAGVGGAEMMLARLIQYTEHQYQHVIIALMKTSEVYQSTLDRCQSHYALGLEWHKYTGYDQKTAWITQTATACKRCNAGCTMPMC